MSHSTSAPTNIDEILIFSFYILTEGFFHHIYAIFKKFRYDFSICRFSYPSGHFICHCQ